MFLLLYENKKGSFSSRRVTNYHRVLTAAPNPTNF